jgi:hypothetical protein
MENDTSNTVGKWGRAALTEQEERLCEEAEEAFLGAYKAAPSGEGVMGAAHFGCRAAVLALRGLPAPEAVAKAIGEIGTYGVPRKYKLVSREPGDPL